MTEFRVTKYDPRMRLSNGHYPPDEWTSVSDIGREFLGRVFDYQQYMMVENNYIEAIRRFLRSSGVSSVQVKDLEIHATRSSLVTPLQSETATRLLRVANNSDVSGIDLDWIARLALREALWCRLEGMNGFYVHFGYDYYMYIGSTGPLIAPTMPQGMYAEQFVSPHHREPSEE